MKDSKSRFLRFVPLALLAWAGHLPLVGASDLESARQRQLNGQANDGSSAVILTLSPSDGLAGLQRSVSVGDDGSFSAPLKLFPGPNTIEVDSAAGRQTRRVEINVAAPNIRIELTWAGQFQDYDLYCNAVYYGRKDADGGHLDRDVINQQEPATENITFDQAAAGTYHVFANYFAPHTVDANGDPVTDPDTGQVVANPVPTTVRIFVNDQQIFSDTRTIAKPEYGIGDGSGTWSVCTLVVHSGDRTGGYQVDVDGFRDLLPQKSVLNRVNPRTPFEVDSLQGPGGTGDVYLMVGQSAQFTASGSINLDTDNQENGVNLIGQFATSSPAVASIDEMGVLTALTPGNVMITAGADGAGYSSPSTSASAAQTSAPQQQQQQAGAPIQAHVLGATLIQSNYPDAPNRQINAGEAALITAEPRMPQLMAQITGDPPPGSNVTWSLTTAYERRGPRDNKTFGPAVLPAAQSWDIGTAFGNQFCGGAATLTYQIQGMPRRSVVFNIRGVNPLDAAAKAYIIAHSGEFTYAWAIAQHESRTTVRRRGADTVYNQFNPPEVGTRPGEPNFGAPDGWGMFQRDPSDGGLPAITDEVWGWQINVARAVQELGIKKASAQRFFDAVRAYYEPRHTWEAPPAAFLPPGCARTNISAMDAAVLTLYNGAAGCPTTELTNPNTNQRMTFQSCWTFDETAAAGSRWSFHANANNYVYKVIHDEVEGGLPFVE